MRYCINEKAIISKDNGELVILNMENGKFYGVDDLGTEIWELLQKGKSCDQITQQLHKNYNEPIENIKRDLQMFINNLYRFGLVHINE